MGLDTSSSLIAFHRRNALKAIAGALLASPVVAASVAPTAYRLTRRGDRLYVAARINGHAVEALLDSAAETSLVDTAFAKTLKLAQAESATAHGSGAASLEAGLAPHVRIEAAGVVIPDATVGVIDLADVGKRLLGRPIDLIVGREIFDRARLLIDMSAGVIRPFPARRTPRGVALPLTTGDGTERFPVAIEGTPALAEFDLGNGSGVIVSRAFVAAHLKDARPQGVETGGGLGGAKKRATIMLKALTIAGRAFENVPASIDDDPRQPDCNVGVGLLQHFRIVSDFSHRTIWLEG